MKQRIFTLTFLFALLCSIGTQAQEVLIHGDNLNIGSNNTIIQNRGNAIGSYNIVNSQGALAVGMCDTIEANSINSVALGENNKVYGVAAMAFGNNIKVNGGFSLGMGRFLKTNCGYSITIGNGIVGAGNLPNLFLENNYNCCLIIGFKSTKPTLTVGPSPNDYPHGSLTFDRTGKVAIGDVPVPEIVAKLHIRSDEGEDAGVFLEPKDLENSSTFIRLRDEGHGIEVDNNGDMSITAGDNTMSMQSTNITMAGATIGLTSDNTMDLQSTNITLTGKVGINTNNESDTYALAVDGGILTNEVFIKNVDEWYDNVFAKDYKLLSLSDLKRYVNEFGHLPEVPSETEVLAEGYNMAEMQSILLKKIEELTLYTLKQQEELEMLKQTIEELKGK